MDTPREKRSNGLGPVGKRVAKALTVLRGQTSIYELSKKLTELGRPILPTGINKIEHEQRRVDVDDLVALALAMRVTPNRLLLPGTARPDADVALAETAWANEYQAWRWARGEMAISGGAEWGAAGPEFGVVNRPDDPVLLSPSFEELAKHGVALRQVVALLTRLHQETDWSTSQILHYAQIAEQVYAPQDEGH